MLLPSSFVRGPQRPAGPRQGPWASNGTAARLSMKLKDSYHVQLVVSEQDPVDNVLRKFRLSVNQTGLVREARRRMRFEDTRLEKKRRAREYAAARKSRFPAPPTLSQVDDGRYSSPFADLFPPSEFQARQQNRPKGANRDLRRIPSGPLPPNMPPKGGAKGSDLAITQSVDDPAVVAAAEQLSVE